MVVVQDPSPEQLLASLDERQRQVATTFGGPVVVIAGAGTGKTTAITHRIAYGCATGAYDPRAVLAVTFTTKAAGEMRGRLRGLGLPSVATRTFHSAALRQLRYFWPKATGSPLPEVTSNRMGLVADAARLQGLRVDAGVLRDLVTEVGWAKVSNVAPDDYPHLALASGRQVAGLDHTVIAAVARRYESVKIDRGLVDFDDLLLCIAALMNDYPDVAAEVRRTYRHLVVDEYQDVSPLQQAVLNCWLGDSDDICVVGDPAQTIHSFAGANSHYLTNFTVRHPNARVISLVTNYRSSSNVVQLANKLSARQRVGLLSGVELVPSRPRGPDPVFLAASAESDEAAAVVAWFQELARGGLPYREMAVLFRLHAQSPTFEAALSDAGIPYVVRGSEGFYDRPEVRQALGTITVLPRVASDEPPRRRIESALAGLGYTAEPPSGAGSLREKWESWAALMGVVDDLVEDNPELTLDQVVAELLQRAAITQVPVGDAVTLATLHAAKGLEWEAVALVGLQEGTMPCVLASGAEQIAEEERLLYVGITRARHHLSLSWSGTRRGVGRPREASRFLVAIQPTVNSVTTPVRRRRKGRGTALAENCRICGKSLETGADHKLGRHAGCPSSYDEALLEALKDWRRSVAARQQVPAYCVFTDATLVAIAEVSPTTEQQLRQISGIGAVKLLNYGTQVLDIVSRASGNPSRACQQTSG